MAFAWRSLLCMICTENPICQYTKREGGKFSSPSYLVLPEYIFASSYIQNKLYLRSLEGKKQEQFFTPCNLSTFTSYFFCLSTACLDFLTKFKIVFWECFGFLFCSSVVISKKFPEITLHSASLPMLGSHFEELLGLTVILLIAENFRKVVLLCVS